MSRTRVTAYPAGKVLLALEQRLQLVVLCLLIL